MKPSTRRNTKLPFDSAQGAFLRKTLRRAASLLIPLGGCLLAGALLILASGENPLTTYANLFDSGFSCHDGAGRCAFLTTLQFATPLIFSGLSAAVALRAGFFSIGQAGQMLLGAAGACWLGSRFSLPAGLHPALALGAAAFCGALWGLVPALLREYTGANEIIVTLLLNPIAGALAGLFPLGRIRESARLLPLVIGTKLSAGFPLALLFAGLVYLLLWKTGWGLAVRSAAQAPRFAQYAGVNPHKTVISAMLLSGALAGLAGAVEVLGVHYHYVSTFSAVNDFDGLIVAFAGGLHPLGVILLSVLLGGLRSGAIVGLQIRSGIPRELGGALIALLLIFTALHKFYRANGKGRRRDIPG
ncbi:MAG: ral nucleoside transport system permease protein [Chloroflexota bacterium]|nr:ral nucleoside transport system permease protein [Chloroflexota bacterium]